MLEWCGYFQSKQGCCVSSSAGGHAAMRDAESRQARMSLSTKHRGNLTVAVLFARWLDWGRRKPDTEPVMPKFAVLLARWYRCQTRRPLFNPSSSLNDSLKSSHLYSLIPFEAAQTFSLTCLLFSDVNPFPTSSSGFRQKITARFCPKWLWCLKYRRTQL